MSMNVDVVIPLNEKHDKLIIIKHDKPVIMTRIAKNGAPKAPRTA